MEKTLDYIQGHQHDFIWCKSCNSFNSAVNEECFFCGSTDFDFELTDHIEEELTYNTYVFGYEAKDVCYTVK